MSRSRDTRSATPGVKVTSLGLGAAQPTARAGSWQDAGIVPLHQRTGTGTIRQLLKLEMDIFLFQR